LLCYFINFGIKFILINEKNEVKQITLHCSWYSSEIFYIFNDFSLYHFFFFFYNTAITSTNSCLLLKNDKTIIAYHFGQYYSLLQKEWRLPKIEIEWLIKVLRNGSFHNGPVICPRLGHNGPRKVVLTLGVASDQYNMFWKLVNSFKMMK
jgi:hypothetical protein